MTPIMAMIGRYLQRDINGQSKYQMRGHSQGKIGFSASGDEEMINLLLQFRSKLVDAFGSVELVRTELHSLCSLIFGGREDYNFSSECSGELDGHVSKTTDPNYADDVTGHDGSTMREKSAPDGGTTAHERSGVLGVEAVWPDIEVPGGPNDVRAVRALVAIMRNVFLSIETVLIVT